MVAWAHVLLFSHSECVAHVCASLSACGKSSISSVHPRVALVLFPLLFVRGWWHLHKKLRLISTPASRGGRERFCLIWLVLLTCFQTAIKPFVLKCPVTGILSFFFQKKIHHPSLFYLCITDFTCKGPSIEKVALALQLKTFLSPQRETF